MSTKLQGGSVEVFDDECYASTSLWNGWSSIKNMIINKNKWK